MRPDIVQSSGLKGVAFASLGSTSIVASMAKMVISLFVI